MKFPFWRRRRNEELDNEINDHLRMAIRERVERGESPEDAEIHAQKELGNMGLVKEVTRNSWGWRWLEQSGQDLSYGMRMLVKNRSFTLIAIITLTLGIGANTVIFSIINAALFRPRPVAQPERLVELYSGYTQQPYQTSAYQDFQLFRQEKEIFSDLAAYNISQFKIGGLETVDQIWGETVSGNYFDVLGVKPFRGRTFAPDEDQTPASHPVAVISHSFWQRQLDADPGAIGKTITLNNQTLTVIGIAPPEYTGMIRGLAIDVWVPLMMVPQLEPQRGTAILTSRGNSWLFIIGRMQPDVTLEKVRARFDLIAAQLRATYPDAWGKNVESNDKPQKVITILPESETRIPPDLHTAAYALSALLLAIVNVVLLIACMNLANLLLARATVRRKEIAVRLALGAGRFRIVRQLLTESLLLAVIAGIFGGLFSVWVLNLLMVSIPPLPEGIRLVIDLRLDWEVLLCTAVFSVVVGVLFGLAPALHASGSSVITALKSGADVLAGGHRQSRFRNALIVTQIALSLLMVVGAGLVFKSARNVRPTSLGFDSLNMVVAPITLDQQQYNRSRSHDFYIQLDERIRALPGVRSVSFVDELPGGLMGRTRSSIGIEGYHPGPNEDMQIDINIIGPGYLTAMKIPIVMGRDIDERDRDGAPCVAVINEAFAKRYLGDQPAIGKHLIRSRGQQDESCAIIGIVRDNKFQSLEKQPAPWYGLPLLQFDARRTTMLVQTSRAPDNLIVPVRQTIRSLDRSVPVADIRTLSGSFAPVMFIFQLLGLIVGSCGLLAILLATIGIYGVVAFGVSQRTREIGIRMALGADRPNVLRLVVRQGMILVLLGLVFGLFLSAALTPVLTSSIFEIHLLNGVSATDPLTFIVISALFAGVALLGCYIPGRRATKVDPMVALRYE